MEKQVNEFKMMSWNLGNSMYSDKYFTGAKKDIKNNVLGQIELIKEIDADIMLFQEISKLEPQNNFINPYKKFKKALPNYNSSFYASVNILNLFNNGKETFYKSRGVSKPLVSPYKLKGYINNLSYSNKTSIITEIPINNHNLVIINIHLVPFNRYKKTRELQLNYLINYALIEYHKGNFVVIGGDFNMNLSLLEDKLDNDSSMFKYIKKQLEINNFKLASPKFTRRSLKDVYSKDSPMYKIDGFLLSFNIKLLEVEEIEDFRFSDHSPIVIKILI